MYDSDEVRDAVRNEVARNAIFVGKQLTREESAVIAELRQLERERLEQQLHEVFVAQDGAFQRFAEHMQEALERLAAIVKPVIDDLQEWFDIVNGIVSGIERRPSPPRPRRRRTPEVRPVQRIDPVAAGRHPAMILRGRRVGGRRGKSSHLPGQQFGELSTDCRPFWVGFCVEETAAAWRRV